MRLICPNCGAQYDVADDAIPVEGRDVQCSNCGHTWFESPDAPTAEEEDSPVVVPQMPPVADPVTPQSRPTPPAPTPPAPTPPAPPPPPPVAVRQQLDPSIADILREEAAREEAVRRAETRGMPERQDELPLAAPERVRRKGSDAGTLAGRTPPEAVTASPSIAPPPVPPAMATTTAGPTTGTRREMFPDIEEINSTLRSSADREALPLTSTALAEQDRRSGRIGFFGTLAIIGLLVLVYANTDTIGTSMPALAGPMDAYADTVDRARTGLDTWVQGLLSESQATPE